MKKTFKLLAVILAFTFLITACSKESQSSEENVSVESSEVSENKDTALDTEKEAAKDLVLNLEGGDWGYPSPYTHYSRGPGSFKMRLIFDSLLERGEEGMIPHLAESWEIDDTGTEYFFKIRDGVLWHDGEPMTADDIKFTIEYYKDHPPVSDDLKVSVDDFIEEINVIDDHNISIKVNKADATLLERFGSFRILPRHIWENIDDPTKFETKEAVIGCGPYKLVDYNKEQGAYKFEAFEDYWGPRPSAKLVQFLPVSDNILAFDNGEIDITSVTPDILSKYQDDPQYKVVEDPAFWGYKLLFNMEKREEFKDKDLRHAMAYAIDKEELIEKVARGAGKPASPGYLPVQHQMYNPDVRQYDFDLDKARELMDGRQYEFSMITGNSNSEVRIAELIKLSLAEIGIDVDITSLDTKSRDAAIKAGEYDLALNGHGGWGGDPSLLKGQYASGTIPGYSNEEIDNLIEEQFGKIDIEERRAVINELQELIAEEMPMIPLYNTVSFTVYRPEKYDGWKHVFNHHEMTHNKISFIEMD